MLEINGQRPAEVQSQGTNCMNPHGNHNSEQSQGSNLVKENPPLNGKCEVPKIFHCNGISECSSSDSYRSFDLIITVNKGCTLALTLSNVKQKNHADNATLLHAPSKSGHNRGLTKSSYKCAGQALKYHTSQIFKSTDLVRVNKENPFCSSGY